VSSIGVAVTDEESLTDMVWANAERFADAVSFRRRAGDSWLDVTARDFAGHVLGVAKGLVAAELQPGEKVTSACTTGYEWALAEFASWAAGCVSVTSGGQAVVEPAGLEELIERGRGIDDEVVHARRLAVTADDAATSELTHRDLLGEVRSTIARYPRQLGAGNSMLITAPELRGPARVLALCSVYTRTTLAIGRGADLGTVRPTVVVSGPELLDEVYEAARRRAHAEDRGRFFAAAEAVAVEFSRALDGLGPSLALRGKHVAASRFVYPKVRAALGGRCTAVLCVGGPVGERLRHFFRGVGVAVLSV
jgi:long-chain acyl-CoA synthetase